MSIERQYIRQFLNESKKLARKFENDNYLYAYTTKDRAEHGGWEVQDSIEELESEWDDFYGEFDPNNVLVLQPATSVDKAMVLSAEPTLEGDFIYPSIDAAINGSTGLYALGWEEDATLATITEEEVQELLQTKDLKRAEELLAKAFVDVQDFGYFEGLYEYVSGPMPEEDGMTPGRTLVKNKKQKAPVKDFEYYRRKVLANPFNIKEVPDEFKTPELCKIAVEEDGMALKYVPDKLKTPELCKIAVEDGGMTLEYVPDKLITFELCKLAVEDDVTSLSCVPDKFKTPELCKIAVEDIGSALEYIPDRLKTPELCRIAVEESGWALEYVPDKLKTPELCKTAVEQNSSALQFVPDRLKEQVKQELGIK